LPALPPVCWRGRLFVCPSSSRGTPNSPPSSLPPICACICAHVCGVAQSTQGQVFIAPSDATHATHATNLRGEGSNSPVFIRLGRAQQVDHRSESPPVAPPDHRVGEPLEQHEPLPNWKPVTIFKQITLQVVLSFAF
jgi:hypothetical protein